MRRVVRLVGTRAWRALPIAVSLLVASVALPAAAQELPACDDERRTDCRLPDWAEAGAPEVDSLFGPVDGIVWVDDAAGDAAPGAIDILGVGIGSVEVTDARGIRKSDGLLKAGKAKKAVRNGRGLVIRILLDRPIEVADGHAGVHVATDIDDSRGSNAPSGVGQAGNPFAGSQDVYSVTYAATTGATKLHDSDLARAWYQGKDPFAAAWAAPEVLDLLVSPQRFGREFTAATFVSGPDGGYDRVTLGPAAIPADGDVGLVPLCLEGSIAVAPFTIRRVVIDGQRVDGVETASSWRGGAVFPIDEAARVELEDLMNDLDEDGDGEVALPASVNLFEDGQVFQHRTEVGLSLDGDRASLWAELGLTKRGYNVLRGIDIDATDRPEADAWLDRAATALRDHTPPFRSARKSGLLVGEGIGSCIAAITPPPAPPAEEDGEAAPSA